ncbi:hypothetical protein QS430_09880 [Staphylococcus pseudintermedius]|nr:hypothetical protein QS430_09880 [Staphylococcus pseudintermedius]
MIYIKRMLFMKGMRPMIKTVETEQEYQDVLVVRETVFIDGHT